MDHQDDGPHPEERTNAVFRDLIGPDARVLLGLLVVGGLGLGLLYALTDERSPDPDTVAACEAWQAFRAELVSGTMSDDQRLARVRDLDRVHRDALPEPRTFDGVHAEVAENGEHVENYARRVDASCAPLVDG